MPYLVQRTPVDDEPGQPHFMGKHRFRVARIDNHRTGRERPAVLLHPPKYFRTVFRLVREAQQPGNIGILQQIRLLRSGIDSHLCNIVQQGFFVEIGNFAVD